MASDLLFVVDAPLPQAYNSGLDVIRLKNNDMPKLTEQEQQEIIRYDALKDKVARFIEKLGYEAVILHEQANKGMTVIEKIETNTDVGFAIVLYTPDDKGNVSDLAVKGELHDRARQNVVFEHGYLISKLGRKRVIPLVSGKVELPSDINGYRLPPV